MFAAAKASCGVTWLHVQHISFHIVAIYTMRVVHCTLNSSVRRQSILSLRACTRFVLFLLIVQPTFGGPVCLCIFVFVLPFQCFPFDSFCLFSQFQFQILQFNWLTVHLIVFAYNIFKSFRTFKCTYFNLFYAHFMCKLYIHTVWHTLHKLEQLESIINSFYSSILKRRKYVEHFFAGLVRALCKRLKWVFHLSTFSPNCRTNSMYGMCHRVDASARIQFKLWFQI